MTDEVSKQLPLAEGSASASPTPKSLDMNDVKAIIADINPGWVTFNGDRYAAMAAKLDEHAGNLIAHAEHIAKAWAGKPADDALRALQLLHSTTAQIGSRTSEAADTYKWLGNEILPWYKDSASSMTDGFITTDADGERARALLDNMNTRVAEANNSLPTYIDFTVPDPKIDSYNGTDGSGVTVPTRTGGPGSPGYAPGDTGASGIGPGTPGGPGDWDPGVPSPGGPGTPLPGNDTDLAGAPPWSPPGTPLPGGPGGNPFTPGGPGLAPAGPGLPGGPGAPGPFSPGVPGTAPPMGSGPRPAGLPRGLGGTVSGPGGPLGVAGRGLGPGGVIGGVRPGVAGTAGAASGRAGMPIGGTAGGSGEAQEHTRTTWLSEDEDVWGTDADVAPPVIG